MADRMASHLSSHLSRESLDRQTTPSFPVLEKKLEDPLFTAPKKSTPYYLYKVYPLSLFSFPSILLSTVRFFPTSIKKVIHNHRSQDQETLDGVNYYHCHLSHANMFP